MKGSALAFRNFFGDTLSNKLGFKLSLADPDVWYKAEVDADGNEYYSYILVYVDDLCILHKDPKRYMDLIEEDFKLKPGSVQTPTQYLGCNVDANIRYVHRTLDRILQLHVASHRTISAVSSRYSTA